MSAGHDTTKNAIAGGMEALIANPGELAKVQADPDLINPLFEEIVRWTTPVNYMMRHAARALFRELTERIEFIECTADPVWIRSSFVVGLKSLPVRYRIRPGA